MKMQVLVLTIYIHNSIYKPIQDTRLIGKSLGAKCTLTKDFGFLRFKRNLILKEDPLTALSGFAGERCRYYSRGL
jgi:hypothetical protein